MTAGKWDSQKSTQISMIDTRQPYFHFYLWLLLNSYTRAIPDRYNIFITRLDKDAVPETNRF